MNLSKLDPMLCLAFQESDGPFYIKITKIKEISFAKMNKEDIKLLSDDPDILTIEIIDVKLDRRWSKRLSKDRRKMHRY